uniref:Phospholipid phosphatase 4 n=1 Tax=Equus caballus TaxID=9796 RepID=A0A5F5PI71_HORSE
MRELAIEIGVRALLFGVFVFTEFLDPFQRVIQPEEIWLYKNPLVQSDNIPTRLMFAISFLTPLAVICVVKIIRRTDKTEIKEAFLAVSLALALNGVCTNTIKLIVGRGHSPMTWIRDANLGDRVLCIMERSFPILSVRLSETCYLKKATGHPNARDRDVRSLESWILGAASEWRSHG